MMFVYGWLPEGTTQGDLDDGDFAWLSDAYKKGEESKTEGRKLPYKIHGKVNEAGWRAAWSRAHQMDDADFSGGPSREKVYETLLADKPAGIDVSEENSAPNEENAAPTNPTPTPVATIPGPRAGESSHEAASRIIEDRASHGLPLPSAMHVRTYALERVPTPSPELGEDEFECHAATFGVVDSWGTIAMPGAFTWDIPRFLAEGSVCWQHDWDQPIGLPLNAYEDMKGFYVRGNILPTRQGSDALILLRAGAVRKMSFGFELLDSHFLTDEEGIAMFGEEDYLQKIADLPWFVFTNQLEAMTKIKTFEVSPVTVPANPEATILGVRNGGISPVGMRLDDHYRVVHDATGKLLDRFRSLKTMRERSGRVLSEANRTKLDAMRTSLADMRDSMDEHIGVLDELLIDPTGPDTGDEMLAAGAESEQVRNRQRARALYARFLYTEAVLNGNIPIN